MDKLKSLLMKNVNNLTTDERFDLIYSLEVPKDVLNFLKQKLQHLTIEVLGNYNGNIIELMNKGALEGWCWQTTESAILFFDDNDYIERGILKFEHCKEYFHSWICFFYSKNKKFIFDPCLQVITDASLYYHIFEISIQASINAKEVKNDLIYRIKNNKKKSSNKHCAYFENFLSAYLSEDQKTEISVFGDNDINSAMFRNTTGYNITIENDEVKSLTAHYYYG